jgi:hypothetical protein
MREIRPSGSEGGGTETNRSFLPLSKRVARRLYFNPSRGFSSLMTISLGESGLRQFAKPQISRYTNARIEP